MNRCPPIIATYRDLPVIRVSRHFVPNRFDLKFLSQNRKKLKVYLWKLTDASF